MYTTKIPQNMSYIFENADYLLTQSAVFWLNKSYLNQTPVNKQAYQDILERLSRINKPCNR